MADGYIEFSTTLDNSDLQKQLKAAEKEIDQLKAKIEGKESESNAIEEQMADARRAIEETSASIDKLKKRYAELGQSNDAGAAARRQVVSQELDKQYATLDKQYDALDKLQNQWSKVDSEIQGYSAKLGEARQRYAVLGQAAQQEAAKSRNVFANMSTAISNSMSALVSRVNMAFKRMVLFGLILGGINAIRNAISSLIADNVQFGQSIANLRAVLNGYLSSMLSVVMPALIGIVNTMAAVFGRVASFIDSFFGTNISGAIAAQQTATFSAGNANQAAKATNNQAKAAKKLGKAQKEANRQLMGFDELNVLNKEEAEDAADALDDYADAIGDAGGIDAGGVGGIGGFDPNAGVFQGILDWLDEIRRRIETDVEGPFARIREGLGLIRQGFDELVQGIMTGDWGLAWRGLGDIVIGLLYVLQGAIGAFLSWLDETTGFHFHDFFEGIQLTLQGVVDIIEGVLRGNLEQVITGIFELINGLALTLSGAVDGVIWLVEEAWSGLYTLLSNGIDTIFDDLAAKYPEYAEFFEACKTIAHTVLDAIDTAFHWLLENAGEGLKNWIEGTRQVLSGFLDILVGIFTGDFERIKKGAWEVISGVLAFFGINIDDAEKTISGFVETAKGFVGGLASKVESVIDGVKSTISNGFQAAAESVSWAVDRINELLGGIGGFVSEGLRGAANGVLASIEGALNGAIGGAVDLINGLIDIVNMMPGFWIGQYAWAPYISLPRLAGGAVIPPNREFMAVLGDQTAGRNLEAPEGLIRQIVREESGNQQTIYILNQILSAIQAGKTLECDGYTLAKVVNGRNAVNARVMGVR